MSNEVTIEVLNLAEVSLIVKLFAVVVFIYFIEKSYRFGCWVYDFFSELHKNIKNHKKEDK